MRRNADEFMTTRPKLKPAFNFSGDYLRLRAFRSKAAELGTGQTRERNAMMIEYVKTWLALKSDRRAVTALEYGLIAGVIVAVVAVGFGVLATDLSNKFSAIGGSL
jgi:pilus assembly protein Flp/PilA